MTPWQKLKVYKAAWKIRKEAEKLTDYGFPADLCGLCAIASRMLYRELKEMGFSPLIAAMDDGYYAHVFILLDDYIVDVTATQFDRSEILFATKNSVWSSQDSMWWDYDHTFESEDDLLHHQFDYGWVPEQTFHPIWES